jgi:excisionase family DNA binding protein
MLSGMHDPTNRCSTNPEPMVTIAERLWTVRDVAAYLKASTSYVYKAAERGEVPCRRLGALLRFLPAEVRAWAEGAPASTR